MSRHFSGFPLQLWRKSLGSYAYHHHQTFSRAYDPQQLRGQDNLFRYLPHPVIHLRFQEKDENLDLMRSIAAALVCRTPIRISANPKRLNFIQEVSWKELGPVTLVEEGEEEWIEWLKTEAYPRLRQLSEPPNALAGKIAECGVMPLKTPVVANGRIELLNYLREQSISIDYHRYGNLSRKNASY